MPTQRLRFFSQGGLGDECPSYHNINIQQAIALLQRELAIVEQKLNNLRENTGESQQLTQQERDDLERELEISQNTYNETLLRLRLTARQQTGRPDVCMLAGDNTPPY